MKLEHKEAKKSPNRFQVPFLGMQGTINNVMRRHEAPITDGTEHRSHTLL